jgi:hypothetical protein
MQDFPLSCMGKFISSMSETSQVTCQVFFYIAIPLN